MSIYKRVRPEFDLRRLRSRSEESETVTYPKEYMEESIPKVFKQSSLLIVLISVIISTFITRIFLIH